MIFALSISWCPLRSQSMCMFNACLNVCCSACHETNKACERLSDKLIRTRRQQGVCSPCACSLFANCQHQIFWAIRCLVSSKTFCANVDTRPQGFKGAGGERVAPGWMAAGPRLPQGLPIGCNHHQPVEGLLGWATVWRHSLLAFIRRFPLLGSEQSWGCSAG